MTRLVYKKKLKLTICIHIYIYILIEMIKIFVDVTQKKLNWYFFHKEIYNCESNKSSLEGLKDCLIIERIILLKESF